MAAMASTVNLLMAAVSVRFCCYSVRAGSSSSRNLRLRPPSLSHLRRPTPKPLSCCATQGPFSPEVPRAPPREWPPPPPDDMPGIDIPPEIVPSPQVDPPQPGTPVPRPGPDFPRPPIPSRPEPEIPVPPPDILPRQPPPEVLPPSPSEIELPLSPPEVETPGTVMASLF
ncbi:hypothetical protein OPV22_003342 [Ensete ventricosum]|uniref:Uncharacterized protein n=1 Tax=Ensete ventricosum TaxID=4639 RepID=A0AAV8S0I0_ENSVE|nr:hypothetical protein OPV22_003342 [Ensete ventricosum]